MRNLAVACTLLLLYSIPLASAAQAEASSTPSISLQDQGYSTVTVRGVLTSVDFWFPGPGLVELTESSTFRLHYEFSETLLGDRSTVTIRLNGNEITSASLSSDPQSDHWLEAVLPAGLINRSANLVQLVFYMRNDHVCADPNDPSLWATVFADSSLSYGVGEPLPHPEELDLAQYPQPIYQDALGPKPPIHILLPAEPDAVTLTAAASLFVRLGQLTPDRRLLPNLLPAARLPSAPAVAVGPGAAFPWLATLDDLPLPYDAAQGQYVDPAGMLIPPEVGVLQIVSHASGPQPDVPLLIVSGGDPEGVRRAALTLASRSFTSLLHGRYALVTDPPNISAMDRDELQPGTVTFGDLTRNASDSTIRGRGRRYIYIPFMMPSAWQFQEQQPRISVHFSHAAGLDERSLMVVEVNGTAIGSTRLTDQNATGATLSLAIPPSVLKPGPNALAATFDMRLYDDRPCDLALDDLVWGTVFRDSTLELPYREAAPDFDLGSYAAPFVQHGAIRETTVVLPPALDEAVLTQLLTLAARLGLYSSSDLTHLPVQLPRDAASLPDHHLLMLGLPTQLPLLPELDGWLPIQFDETGALTLKDQDVELLAVQNQQPVGLLQTGNSPWQRGRRVLLISGTTPEAVGWAVEATSPGALSGNVAIVTSADRFATLSVQPAQTAPPVEPEQQLPLWAAAVVGGAVAAILVVTVALVIRRSRPSPYGAHE